MFSQKVKEHLGRRFLRISSQMARFGQHCDLPCLAVDVNSHINVLSFERNFVLLHTGTSFNCECNLFVSTCKYTNQLLSYQLFFHKNYEKHTEGLPNGRGLAAPESEFNSRTYPLATANIVTKGAKNHAFISRND